MQQRWRAIWLESDGTLREFLFDSISNLTIARIDFRLKFSYTAEFEGTSVPERFELEEVANGRAYYQPHLAQTQYRLR